MHVLLQQLINGLSVGSIYALIAVGYTMVYGVLQLINFAHGDVFMVGAALTLLITRWFHFNSDAGGAPPNAGGFILCAAVAVAACGAMGFLIERLAYRPLRNRPRINALITAIGVSLLLEYGFQQPAIFGPTPKSFPVSMIPWIDRNFTIGGIVVSRVDVLVLLMMLSLMIVLSYIVRRTRTGLALRAVSFRFDTAALMGINIDRIISFTFVLGSCLAAAAGILWAIKYPKVEPLMGLLPGVKAFVAAVFGGIGSIAGAVVGGLVLGVIEILAIQYLNGGSQYKDAIAFVILIVILLVKPSGLFGRNTVEKV